MPKGIKYGGRVKGTPNKVTAISKRAISELLSEYNDSGKMRSDFFSPELTEKDRLTLAEKLMQYVMPKMQAVAFTEADEKTRTIEDTLIELSKPKD